MKKNYTIALAILALASCTTDDSLKIESISIVPETATVYTDQALPELALNVTPEGALEGKTVTWTSSKPEIISVKAGGVLAFEVSDIEETEMPVTITATVGDKTAASVITVKGQIAKYQVLDLSSTLGIYMLDRNIGASDVHKSGNYYQWGKNTPVAKEGATKVNSNYSADWSRSDKDIADWSKPENTPCPKGWSIPNEAQMKVIDNAVEAIALFDYDMATKEEYDAAVAVVNSMKLSKSGRFDSKNTDKINLPNAVYFWSSFVSEDNSKIGSYEDNNFPHYWKSAAFDIAMPVRCVKSAK